MTNCWRLKVSDSPEMALNSQEKKPLSPEQYRKQLASQLHKGGWHPLH
jgi:hypothetical protein